MVLKLVPTGRSQDAVFDLKSIGTKAELSIMGIHSFENKITLAASSGGLLPLYGDVMNSL